MANAATTRAIVPVLMPLGDRALLVRFADRLDDAANRAAIQFATVLAEACVPGVVEIVPNLVTVLLRYDPTRIGFAALTGEVRLLMARAGSQGPQDADASTHVITVRFGGDEGPDLAEVAQILAISASAFIAAHNASPLRVLSTGFAPGFVYCGLHPAHLNVPRRTTIRRSVPPGSILFAAGQTAIAATAIPTGWHIIGRTDFRNFDALATPPSKLRAGDNLVFEAAP